MKFFIDANLPISLKEVLSSHGEVQHARDIDLHESDDNDIASHASKNQAILITRDLEFANPNLYPIGKHYGLIIMRVPPFFTALQICNVLKRYLLKEDLERLKNGITVVEPSRVRKLRR